MNGDLWRWRGVAVDTCTPLDRRMENGEWRMELVSNCLVYNHWKEKEIEWGE